MQHICRELVMAQEEIGRLRAIVENTTGETFIEELACILNRYSEENMSNTPDYILAAYLVSCLEAFNAATNQRSEWAIRTWDMIAAESEE